MHVVVVGRLNMDLLVQIPQISGPDKTLLGGVFKTFHVGKNANQASCGSYFCHPRRCAIISTPRDKVD